MNTYINIPWRYQLSDAGAPDIVASSVSLSLLHGTERDTNVLAEQNPGKSRENATPRKIQIFNDLGIRDVIKGPWKMHDSPSIAFIDDYDYRKNSVQSTL